MPSGGWTRSAGAVVAPIPSSSTMQAAGAMTSQEWRRRAGPGGERENGRRLAETSGSFERVAVEDVTRAADAFRGVYETTGGNDGFVSIEVGPHLARDIDGSIAEARRLWAACARPNVMVKIPGTVEGLAAIRRCLSERVNINITLLFSIARYHEVMLAYLAALEARVASGQPVDRLRSVASFFV